MAMDGLALRAVIAELQPLTNGKIDKVQQPEKDLVVLTVRSERANRKLLLHTHAENGRIQLTNASFDNPATAPAFCMLLRRHLLGGRIAAISQDGPDRACTISVAARNDLQDDVQLRLVVELMGKHANMILVGGDGVILDCLRHVSPSETSQRVLLPGFSYAPAPKQGKLDPFQATKHEFAAVFTAPAPVRALTDAFEGVSKASATALLTRCETPDALFSLFSDFSKDRFSPCVVYGADGEPTAVFPFLATGTGSRCTPMESMSAALDRFYTERDANVRIRRHGASLRRTVENALARAEHKYASFDEALHNDEQLETARIRGELILANLYRAEPGMVQLVAENYYCDPPAPCVVPLDGAVSLQENANRYFKQYRKGKLARDYAAKQIAPLRDEIAYLTGQLENIENCSALSELNEIYEELVLERYIRPKQKAAKQQFSKPSKPFRYRSSDGILISVGKNNRQNDQLTLREAKSDNLWLHAKNATGSHVIVDCEGEPPEQTLLEAATLAAYYSSGRAATTVAVDYTPRKFVKKPGGARPGMVIYTTNKTLYVAPDLQRINGLEKA